MPTNINTDIAGRHGVAVGGRPGTTQACAAVVDHAIHAARVDSDSAVHRSAAPRFCSAACFHAWHRQSQDDLRDELSLMTGGPRPAMTSEVRAALAATRPADPRAADNAADWLLGRGGPQRITELALCEFVWYQLPVPTGPSPDPARVAAALGRLFEALDLPRYAQVCTSQVTTELLSTYAVDGVAAGRHAYQRALRRSGIGPPDVAELTWGTVMGIEEVDVYEATAAMLELAVVAGHLVPGAAGWRIRQAELTREYLLAADPERGDASRLDRIRAERFHIWARSRGAGRRALLASLSARLREPARIPPDAAEFLAPLQWLMRRAGSAAGLALTEAHHLDPAMVLAAQEQFGIESGADLAGAEGTCLRTLRELLEGMHAVRRSGQRLVLTRHGHRLLADQARLWDNVVEELTGSTRAVGSVARETALMILADGRQVGRTDLTGRVCDMLAGEGWPDLDPDTVRPALAQLWCRLYALGLLSDERWLRPIRLTQAGQVAAFAAIRARGRQPRYTLGFGCCG